MAGEKKILFIGDDPDLVKVTRRYMDESSHVGVESVSEGLEGIKKLEQERFDLVVLDKDVSDTDGLLLLEDIRKKWPHIKVIILVNEVSDISVGTALDFGVDDVFLKGFDVGFLTEKIEALLE
jgi:two-component system response regulator QseB